MSTREQRIAGGKECLRRAMHAVATEQWKDFRIIRSADDLDVIMSIVPCEKDGDAALAPFLFPDEVAQ